ncbi:MAG: dihydrodipicolinate synthase family protein [Gammaproteobacteria bacterium]
MMTTHRISEASKGVYVIAATPFTERGEIDFNSTDRLMDFYLEEGVHGITVLGIMGEAPKLTEAEQIALVQRVLKRVGGRVPVMVGVSNPGVDNLAALARRTIDDGAAGVMIAPTPGLRTEDQIVGYFAKVFERLGPDIPVCLQDYPPTTQVWMSVATINKLIDDFPSLVMFKHEDAPGLRKLSQLRRAAKDGRRRVSILTANGGLYVPQELLRGADGVNTGFAFSRMLVEMWNLFNAGRADEAEDLYDFYLPILRHEQQFGFGLAVRKEILRRRGAIASSAVRQPGPSLDADDRAELDGLLRRLRRKLELAGRPLPRGL